MAQRYTSISAKRSGLRVRSGLSSIKSGMASPSPGISVMTIRLLRSDPKEPFRQDAVFRVTDFLRVVMGREGRRFAGT
jgi:hypothetical protein